ncbi:unnamed protein product [Rhizophagus irregularis]|nr:unnamed protein product [Rhizophagus irregularis]CAB5375739.1 unnamed protein product [Rhizophagus irregularis]
MSEKENCQDTTECDKSNTLINECVVSNLEENIALVTISSPVNSLEENDTSFTLGGWNFPVSYLEESDTPVTIGGWDFPMNDLEESNWDTPFNWEECYASLLNVTERFRFEIEEIEKKYELEKEQIERIYELEKEQVERKYELEKEKVKRKYNRLKNERIERKYKLEKERVEKNYELEKEQAESTYELEKLQVERKYELIEKKFGRLKIERIKKMYELEKEQIIEIVRNLVNNKSYIVYGYWFCHQWKCEHKKPLQCISREKCEYRNKLDDLQLLYSGKCKHKSQCQSVMECRNKFKRKWQTENNCKLEWRKRYDQELLKKSLEVISERRTGWLEFFQACENNHENLISSFLLYTSENSNKPDLEIIRHLVWNHYYRVFGNWKCSRCQKKWRSAYTWISLQKFITKATGKQCLKGDYVMQKCKERTCGNYGIISSYKPLVRSESGEHKRHLCEKCKRGYECFESGTYFGYQYI